MPDMNNASRAFHDKRPIRREDPEDVVKQIIHEIDDAAGIGVAMYQIERDTDLIIDIHMLVSK